MTMLSNFTRSFLIAALLIGGAAHADVLLPTDPTQVGRLSRNAVPQTWAMDELFPGVINTGINYHYRTYAFNVGLSNYLQISIDSVSANTFFSGYQTSYASTNIAQNWLGDGGGSGNYQFDADPINLVDPRFFNVVAAANSIFLLVVNETTPNAGFDQPFSFLVEGFSTTDYQNPVTLLPIVVAVIPEPSTIALLLAPLALVVVRKRRKAVATG